MMNRLRNLNLALILVLFALAVIIEPANVLASASDKAPLKVGFITVGPVTDWGYNYAHDQGRKYMETATPKQVETSIVEKIPESAEVERVMEKMIANGTRLIFPTSYGYLEPTLRVASRHPDVIFESAGRTVSPGVKNVGTYFAKQYEPMYVAGVVAGRMTKKNELGFVAAHPVPQVLQNINAFTLGVRSVNPKAKVHVIWTNSWSDAPTEAEASKGLIESGVDVLTMHLDSPITVVQTAEKYGIMSVGYHADLKKFAPKGWLTGEMWNWGPLYVKIAESVRNGTWKSANDRYGMKEGYAKLSSFGPSVPAKVQAEALATKRKIENGDYLVFQGPLKDRDGKELLAAGKRPDSNLIENMNWLVVGVEGPLPKK
jgi:basic membrane protein A and related proteins